MSGLLPDALTSSSTRAPVTAVTNPIPLVLAAAASFASILCSLVGVQQWPDPVAGRGERGQDLHWRNVLLSGPAFRRAHVEELSVPGRLVVLHVCIFPHLDDPAPVFGFDLVSGPARVTGVFMDFSPILRNRSGPRLCDTIAVEEVDALGERRIVPSWGGIFSEDFIALRPHTLQDVKRICVLGQLALGGYLRGLAPGSAPDSRPQIAAGHDRYGGAMRQNKHTFRMLAGLIGAAPAHRFINDVLFPPVAMPAQTEFCASQGPD